MISRNLSGFFECFVALIESSDRLRSLKWRGYFRAFRSAASHADFDLKYRSCLDLVPTEI